MFVLVNLLVRLMGNRGWIESLLDGVVPLGVARVSTGFTGELVGPDDFVAWVGWDSTGRGEGEEGEKGGGSGGSGEMHFE